MSHTDFALDEQLRGDLEDLVRDSKRLAGALVQSPYKAVAAPLIESVRKLSEEASLSDQAASSLVSLFYGFRKLVIGIAKEDR